MSKRFRNRRADEVKAFLEASDFKWINNNGDDAIYALNNNLYTVKVPIRNEFIPNGTMDYIKKMIEKNGISRKDILEWWKNNGYGD